MIRLEDWWERYLIHFEPPTTDKKRPPLPLSALVMVFCLPRDSKEDGGLDFRQRVSQTALQGIWLGKVDRYRTVYGEVDIGHLSRNVAEGQVADGPGNHAPGPIDRLGVMFQEGFGGESQLHPNISVLSICPSG